MNLARIADALERIAGVMERAEHAAHLMAPAARSLGAAILSNPRVQKLTRPR